MTLLEAITLGDSMRKANSFDNALKTVWINELEGTVATMVHLISIDDVCTLDFERDKDATLSVKPPYDKIYWAYLCAMVDLALGEYSAYQNSYEVFNSFLKEYSLWYSRNIAPGDGCAKVSGYYISAYATACAHGYEGTEAQWLLSLKGERGETGHGINILDLLGDASLLPKDAITGDIYAVGTKDANELYLYTGDAWVNLGSYKGEKGDAGDKGEKGDKGDTGADGQKGATFTPSVSSDGVLSWTNDGGMQNPADVNIKGPKGDKGDAGSVVTPTFFINEQGHLIATYE